jgi:hypothetical protein
MQYPKSIIAPTTEGFLIVEFLLFEDSTANSNALSLLFSQK